MWDRRAREGGGVRLNDSLHSQRHELRTTARRAHCIDDDVEECSERDSAAAVATAARTSSTTRPVDVVTVRNTVESIVCWRSGLQDGTADFF